MQQLPVAWSLVNLTVDWVPASSAVVEHASPVFRWVVPPLQDCAACGASSSASCNGAQQLSYRVQIAEPWDVPGPWTSPLAASVPPKQEKKRKY